MRRPFASAASRSQPSAASPWPWKSYGRGPRLERAAAQELHAERSQAPGDRVDLLLRLDAARAHHEDVRRGHAHRDARDVHDVRLLVHARVRGRLHRNGRDAVDRQQRLPRHARRARLDQELDVLAPLQAANPKTPPNQLALDRSGVRIILQRYDHGTYGYSGPANDRSAVLRVNGAGPENLGGARCASGGALRASGGALRASGGALRASELPPIPLTTRPGRPQGARLGGVSRSPGRHRRSPGRPQGARLRRRPSCQATAT